MEYSANHRLATYGTLAPGEINANQLDGLEGYWISGFAHGELIKKGWGSSHGCPGCLLNPDGPPIQVSIFVSQDLPDHWERLDAFEGEEYQRVVTTVETGRGSIEVSMYELNRLALDP